MANEFGNTNDVYYQEKPQEESQPASVEETPEVAGATLDPATHAYISRITQREQNLFIEEYYSSTDTKIEFDGIEQFEIGYIQYSVQEQLKPLYGYASRTWDDVAVGNRIVTGAFKVPIRNVKAVDYKNPLNSTPEEIKTYGSSVDSQYTKKPQVEWQEETESEFNAPEWVHLISPGGAVAPVVDTYDENYQKSDYIPEDPDTFVYRQMLQELGYNLTNGSSALTLEEQIKQFQNDMKKDGKSVDMGSYGILTSSTKDLIRKACNKKWASNKTITVKERSKIYMGPSVLNQVVTSIPSDCEFVVLSDSIQDSNGNTWLQITSKDGNYYGYYCKELCEP